MIKLTFEPKSPLLIFPGTVEFRDSRTAWLALDTGASMTTISESTLLAIGFTPETMGQLTTFGDASRSHLVRKVTLKSFSLTRARVENLEVLCYTFPEEYGIDGVIGLNFLRQFNISLDFQRGVLMLRKFGSS